MTAKRVVSWPGRGGDLNPFIETFVDSLEQAGCEVVGINNFPTLEFPSDTDAFVIHWPQFIYANAFGYAAKLRTLLQFIHQLRDLKKSGIQIIWLCHDLTPHDWNTMRWQLLWWPTIRGLFLLADGVIALSPGTCSKIERQYSRWIRGKLTWAWHPWYEDVLVEDERALRTRVDLGIDDNTKLIGFFGQLRAQKGVADLVTAFQKLDAPEVHLLIAGAPFKSAPEVSEMVEAAAREDTRIHIILRELEDDEVKCIVAASDLCVFPYRQYTHSGAMIYSLSANRRILTPRTCFSEGLEELHPQWVVLYDGNLNEQILADAAKRPRPTEMIDLASFSPTLLAAKVMAFT
ncbi:glycosyltransferase [Pseudohalioglobus lutimaris]|uniref:Uncharacterized protein n=1 Tax=Pseudohalioglobus lutimaris TaxID=1737061 RepID=A0A2N5WZA7_9GAMM|nr:glycosyltransferase [Pseudohalioglobus lutimaris]PLW67581.1 hypothetical protein C0039_16220 [Pseudohalioglobus lutimaris]